MNFYLFKRIKDARQIKQSKNMKQTNPVTQSQEVTFQRITTLTATKQRRESRKEHGKTFTDAPEQCLHGKTRMLYI